MISKLMFTIDGWGVFCGFAHRRILLDLKLIDDEVNIGLGNGLEPSGIKPLPKPILTKISDTIGYN